MTNPNGAEQPLDHQSWPQQYDGIHKRASFSKRRVAEYNFLESLTDNYLGMRGYATLAEIREKVAELAPGIPESEILLNFWQLRWTSDATPEEIAEREAAKARSEEHKEQWERETLRRLTEKYGQPGESS